MSNVLALCHPSNRRVLSFTCGSLIHKELPPACPVGKLPDDFVTPSHEDWRQVNAGLAHI